MSYHKELDFNNCIDSISGLQFSIMSPEEIEKRSVAEIVTQETYEGENPKIGGLFDPRMGVLDHGKICPTDGLDNRFCPGYFGHIKLAQPVLHIQFMSYIIRTLKCVCWRCSSCLIDLKSPEHVRMLSRKKGFYKSTYIYNECRNIKRCGQENENGCGALQPSNIKKESSSIGKICAEWKISKSEESSEESKKIIWTADDILKILKRIDIEELELMGFSRHWCLPHWMVCTVLPVPPPSVRPSVRNDTNTRMEDDLTHKLCDIVKTNRILKQKIEAEAPSNIIDEWCQLLQYHIATLIDNSQPGIPPAQQRSGRPLKSIRERLRSKEGRVRGNLMGKRVDFSARSVITPDPNIEIDQLGVPIKIAKNLTYPEKVTKFNIKFLSQLVSNGYDSWPGAKSIKKKDGKLISLRHIDSSNIELEIGDVVNRHIVNDDIVLFNRQPSLHRMSMMSHRVKVMNYQSFRLNVSVTTPYNADFDGDEMNMHVPQSVQTAIEIDKLANVVTQIISPAQNRPIISFVQDTLLGSFMFTQYSQYFNEHEVFDLLVTNKIYDGILPEPSITKGTTLAKVPFWFSKDKYYHYFNDNNVLVTDLWNGRDLISLLIPDINLVQKNNHFNDSIEKEKFMNKIVVDNGKLVNGILDKSVLGGKDGGLIHLTYNEYGGQSCKDLLDGIQGIITKFMMNHSFSVGIGDLVANNKAIQDMKKVVNNQKKKVIELIEAVHNGLLENNSGKSLCDEFELQVNGALNEAIGAAGNIAKNYLPNSNRMINIVKSGSKGSVINIGQMIALVGQQNVDGKRIPYGFADRTLPHFHKYDDGPSARGFVENSFLDGLNPHEFFFHAMGGREGVIDTAVKTSETGYIQRKLVKAMEDLKIENDFTVRNSNGIIIQLLYGEDGFNPVKIETQYLQTLKMDYTNLVENYHLDLNNFEYENYFTTEIIDNISSNLEKYISLLNLNFDRVKEDRRFIREDVLNMQNEEKMHYPVNIARLCNNTKKNFPLLSDKSDLDPLHIITRLNEIKTKCVVPFADKKSNRMMMILCRAHLSPKYAILKNKLSRVAFDNIIDTIIIEFTNSIDQPGALVGIIAAQSIGEPATQMTLNTFHFAGVGSKSEVVRGVPRLKEIISASKNIKSPLITAFLNQNNAYDKEKATKVLNNIGITTIKNITLSTDIYFDNDNVEPFEKGMLEIYNEFEEYGIHNYKKDTENVNPWVLRFKFNRQEMLDREIRMIDVYHAINLKFNKDSKDTDDIICVYSDDNASELIFRIQCIVSNEESNDCDEDDMINLLKTLEDSILNDIVLKGTKNIEKASMSKDNKYLKKEGDDYNMQSQWVIEATGNNLLDILNNPNINYENTYCNNVNEIYDVLGIEATRTAIINEITDLLSFDNTYINYRHIALLADTMTNRGSIMSIDRHGINKSERGPLAKCSFEETPDIISKAAVYGEYDNIRGVSSNIMLGQEVKAGTTHSDILFDEQMFLENMGRITTIKSETEVLDQSVLDNMDDYCDDDNFGFNFER